MPIAQPASCDGWPLGLGASHASARATDPIGSEEVAINYVDGVERQAFGASYTCGDDPLVGDQSMHCGDNADAALTSDGACLP